MKKTATVLFLFMTCYCCKAQSIFTNELGSLLPVRLITRPFIKTSLAAPTVKPARSFTYKKTITKRRCIATAAIPFFLYSLREKNKSGLKLTSQRTTCGNGNRSFKKVTSITFAIPIGN